MTREDEKRVDDPPFSKTNDTPLRDLIRDRRFVHDLVERDDNKDDASHKTGGAVGLSNFEDELFRRIRDLAAKKARDAGIRDPDRIDDAAQEIILTLLEDLRRRTKKILHTETNDPLASLWAFIDHGDITDFTNWFGVLAYHKAIGHDKNERLQQEQELTNAEDMFSLCAPQDLTPEQRESLKRALEPLPYLYRCFMLARACGYSVEEIAVMYQCQKTTAAVSKIIQRAHKSIQKNLFS